MLLRKRLNDASESLAHKSETSTSEDDETAVDPDKIKKLRKLYRYFQPQESLVTTLRHNNKHFETLINSGAHFMMTMCIYDIITNSLEKGHVYFDIDAYFSVFGPFINYFTAISIWSLLMGGVLAVYFMFLLWKSLRPSSQSLTSVDVLFAVIYIAYNLAAHAAVIGYIIHSDLAPAPSLFLSVEQTRLTMKTYSFLRENIYKVLWPWKENDRTGPAVWYPGQMKPEVGSLSQYLYFVFAPTLLYRDEYPRTAKIRWNFALQYFLEFVFTVVVLVMCLKNFIRPSLEMIPSNPAKYMTISCLTNMVFGTFTLFMTNSCILHQYMNLMAELTCFADRHFYEDWWTCVDFKTFYRKWNHLVYDWIHAYIYRDLRSAFNNSVYRKIAALPPILISSIFHEYIIAVGLKFFFPVLTFQFFCLGGIVYFVRPTFASSRHRLWNTLFLWGISIGMGLMVWGYSVEYYARVFCPTENTIAAAFKPQLFHCFFGNGTLVHKH